MSTIGDTVRVDSGRWADHYTREGVVVNIRSDPKRGGLRQVCCEFDPGSRRGDVLWIDDAQVTRLR